MPKLSETLARELFNDILSRRLQPGTMLPPEATMLAQYGVGRASLREALRVLEVYGIVRVKPGPGGGPVVARVTPADFGRTASVFFQATGATHEQLIETRLILEPIMARLDAERITEEGQNSLRDLLVRARDVMDSDGAEWGAASSDFHAALGALHGNQVLRLFGTSLACVQDERMRSAETPGDRKEVLRVHERIAEAIINGDANGAERLTRAHLVAISERQSELSRGALNEVIRWI
jgi:DNA-binding FadR family transcriptional regulator